MLGKLSYEYDYNKSLLAYEDLDKVINAVINRVMGSRYIYRLLRVRVPGFGY